MAATPQETVGVLPRPVPPSNRFALLNPRSFLAPAIDIAPAEAGDMVIAPSGLITERMTSLAQTASAESPFFGQTWLTYYGRPGIAEMGILGEYEIADLAPLLRKQAREYDIANGRGLGVMPAFHLVYGMATVASGDDGNHLAYLEHEAVMAYIEAAAEEEYAVILDVQIGALSPTEAISLALPYLAYEHVHLAIDPEFAMVHEGQAWPRSDRVCDWCGAGERGAVGDPALLRRNRLAGNRAAGAPVPGQHDRRRRADRRQLRAR